jgi:hypothetical protein
MRVAATSQNRWMRWINYGTEIRVLDPDETKHVNLELTDDRCRLLLHNVHNTLLEFVWIVRRWGRVQPGKIAIGAWIDLDNEDASQPDEVEDVLDAAGRLAVAARVVREVLEEAEATEATFNDMEAMLRSEFPHITDYHHLVFPATDPSVLRGLAQAYSLDALLNDLILDWQWDSGSRGRLARFNDSEPIIIEDATITQLETFLEVIPRIDMERGRKNQSARASGHEGGMLDSRTAKSKRSSPPYIENATSLLGEGMLRRANTIDIDLICGRLDIDGNSTYLVAPEDRRVLCALVRLVKACGDGIKGRALLGGRYDRTLRDYLPEWAQAYVGVAKGRKPGGYYVLEATESTMIHERLS